MTRLSKVEGETLRLFLGGKTVQQIAKARGRKIRSVFAILRQCRSKSGFHTVGRLWKGNRQLLVATVSGVDGLNFISSGVPPMQITQRKIVAGLANGLPHKAIADDAGLKPKTIEYHLRKARKHLSLKSYTTDTVITLHAVRLGLIEWDMRRQVWL